MPLLKLDVLKLGTSSPPLGLSFDMGGTGIKVVVNCRLGDTYHTAANSNAVASQLPRTNEGVDS